MTTLIPNMMPLGHQTVGLLRSRLDGLLYDNGLVGPDPDHTLDPATVDEAGWRLLLCARVLRALERGEFPIEADALDLLERFERETQEMVDDSEGEDLVVAEGNLVMLRVILEKARGRAEGGDA